MSYLLLTGATGLLGGRLLREALRAGLQVAVLVRSGRTAKAAERIKAQLHVDHRDGLPDVCPPVVLAGDLHVSHCGLSRELCDWVAAHCQTIVHCAASIDFQATPQGEPFKSNVEGTRQLLELAKVTGIRHFFHVSTAYVAGLRTGVIREDELDVGQQHGNVYEESKFAAEQLVRRAAHLTRPTIFRPSIIVGDYHTGETSTFHGFYAPLRLGLALSRSAQASANRESIQFLQRLGMQGQERKNLVPVDWVAQVMLHVIRAGSPDGMTYHLTSEHPVTVAEIDRAITEAIATAPLARQTAAEPHIEHVDQFVEQMGVYRSYLRNDPQFDSEHTRRVAPHLPCHEFSHRALVRLAEYAIRVNFKTPGHEARLARFDVAAMLEQHVLTPRWSTTGVLNLVVNGSAGGGWQFDVQGGRIVGCGIGLCANPAAVVQLHETTLQELVCGALSVETAVALGQIIVAAPRMAMSTVIGFLKQLLQSCHPASSAAQPERPLATSERRHG